MCIKCLNAHCIYNAIRFSLKNRELPESLTKYLTHQLKCEDDDKIQFPHIECLSGECVNKCQLTFENDISEHSDNKRVSYYTFEKVETTSYNKLGMETHFSRTAGVDKKAIISELYKLLMDIAQDYIIHRYFVTSGLALWHKFTEVYSKGIMTIDYSKNIQFKAKHEAQSKHFSGRQQTLHCCVIEKNGEHEYIYHLSDDKLHDSEMTFSIIEDIIKNNPSIIECGVLVLRSDNCPTQYKSRFVFA